MKDRMSSQNACGSLFRPRLLVVDDDELYRKLLHDSLKINGFEVHAYGDGKSALDAWNKNSYAGVISDIFMPGMQGYLLLESIKREQPEIPVILISGEAPETVAEKGDAINADAFLRKPVHISELLACLAELGIQTTLPSEIS